jgi:hypothetical protein
MFERVACQKLLEDVVTRFKESLDSDHPKHQICPLIRKSNDCSFQKEFPAEKRSLLKRGSSQLLERSSRRGSPQTGRRSVGREKWR